MNFRWWMYVASFLLSLFFLITGIVKGEPGFVLVAVAIGIGLYFSRNYIH